MSGLRISLVEFSPATGLFQFAFQLGSALAERGHDVELITGPKPELQSSQPGLRLASILPTWHPGDTAASALRRKARRVPRSARHIAAWGILARHIRTIRPDVVQFASWRFAIDGLFAGLIAQRDWSRICVDLCHEPVPMQEQRATASPYKRGRLLDAGLGYGYRAMDSVVVLGQTSKDDLLRTRRGVARCDLIPHGDEEALVGVTPPPAPSSCPPRVVLFGSLTRYKGIDLLLDAWPRVRAEVPTAELLIAGGAVPDLDLTDLTDRAERCAGVRLQLGYVPIPEVAPLVGSGRVFVAPYRRSNASGAVRLAQTLRRPVVVTDVGDLAESVVDGESGLVIPPDDAEALAAAIIQILQDPTRADLMGQAGHDRLKATASWSVVAAELERVYVEVLGPAARTAR